MQGDSIMMHNAKVVAYYKLKKQDLTVEVVKDCSYYDFLLVAYDQSSRFAIKVYTTDHIKSDDIITLTREIQANYERASELRIPIVLLYVNLTDGSLKFQKLLNWNFGIGKIADVRYEQILDWNSKNISILLAELGNEIRVLPESMFSVIKTISIQDEKYLEAKIIYLRKLHEGYKMNQKPGNLSEIESFTRCLEGIPEDYYPSDLLDRKIFEAVKKIYPNSTFRSSLLILNTEIRDLQHYSKLNSSNGRCFFMPDSSSVMDFLSQKVDGIIPNVNVMAAYTPHLRYNPNGVFESNFSVECTIDEINDIENALETYRPLTDYLHS